MKIINKIIESSLSSTIYKLFIEKIKDKHEINMDYIINKINLKNITNFDENYKLIMKNCLQIDVSQSTLNTMKTQYFKILDKEEIEANIEYNANKLRIEFEDKTKQIIKNDLIEKYKQIYKARVNEHAKNGTIILMKKLMNENFIFEDIQYYLEKSHKIKLYVNKLIEHFINSNKL